MRDQAEEWGLPEELIVNWIREFEAFALMDVVRIAEANGLSTEQVARVYYSVYDRFQVDLLTSTRLLLLWLSMSYRKSVKVLLLEPRAATPR